MTRQTIKLVVPVALSACLLMASVKTDFDKKADFSRYRTYSWITVKGSNDLWSDRIADAVDSQLAAKGWSKVQSNGDAAISAFGRVRNEQTLETYYNGFGGMGWGWRGFGGLGSEATTQVENTPVGSLTVDVFDGQSKRLVFRGMSTDTLSDKPDKNEKKLEKAVDEMFKKFPPSGRG